VRKKGWDKKFKKKKRKIELNEQKILKRPKRGGGDNPAERTNKPPRMKERRTTIQNFEIH